MACCYLFFSCSVDDVDLCISRDCHACYNLILLVLCRCGGACGSAAHANGAPADEFFTAHQE